MLTTPTIYRKNSHSASNSISSSTSTLNKTSSSKVKFPLPNATKPRYRVIQSKHIHDLPDDILLSIFRYISPIDLLNISIVCRRWHAVSQDESLWCRLVHSFGLHQKTSTIKTNSSKEIILRYLHDHIDRELNKLFDVKLDPLSSYTGIPDLKRTLEKSLMYFIIALLDEKKNLLFSYRNDDVKYFETCATIRWYNSSEWLTNLSIVKYIRLYAVAEVNMDTRPHRLRRQAPSTVANKDQTYLAKITQQPYRHVQKVRSLLDEYEFKWSSIIKNTKTNENSQSLIRVNTFESDVLIGIYNQDQTFCFLAWNFVYLKFHKQFFNGLNKTQLSSSVTLSQFFTSIAFDQAEVSVFICFRNMRTIFFRHRFRNSKLHSSTKSIEIISVQMTHDIGPQIEILPKFNWKTMLFNGTLDDMFILDIVILNDLKNVAYVATIPAKIQQNLSQEFILSSNAWTINAQTEQIKIEGNIIKLSDEYAALGNENEHSLHLQNLWCHF